MKNRKGIIGLCFLFSVFFASQLYADIFPSDLTGNWICIEKRHGYYKLQFEDNGRFSYGYKRFISKDDLSKISFKTFDKSEFNGWYQEGSVKFADGKLTFKVQKNEDFLTKSGVSKGSEYSIEVTSFDKKSLILGTRNFENTRIYKEASELEENNIKNEKKVFEFTVDNRQWFGTVARACVNDDNLNVRLQPSTSSMKVGKLNKGDIVTIKGFSDIKELIDGFEGYWVKIQIESNESIKDYAGDNDGKFGWIFSKYVDINRSVEVSKFKVIKFNPGTKETVQNLDLEIDRGNNKCITKVIPNKFKNQKKYYFVWSDDIKDFMYSDPVGTFMWDPKTNEITHVSNMGYDCESAWCIVSDDGKYFFQDYGTSPGVRGFAVFDNRTNKRLYSGSYLNDLDFDGKNITVVDYCNWWNINKKRVSEESIKRAEDYKKKLSAKELESRSVVVRYKLNLETLEKKFIDCTTVIEQ